MSRYAKAHENPQGPGDARPTALQIVEDENLVGKLSDKVYVITGVSSGIGVETLRALYATGAHVFGTVRDVPKGQKVVEEIKSKTQGGKITLIKMSMDDLSSIRTGAQEILAQTKVINGLINNAGVMATPEGKTKDGFETQFGTNHLGHFYLFNLLKPTLLLSATPAFPSRVIALSSIGHRAGPVRFHDYNFTSSEPASYTPWSAYGQSKTANIYFSNELERRYASRNLHSTSVHPGGIATGLQVHVAEEMKKYEGNEEVEKYMKSAGQGAATTVFAVLSEEWRRKGGRYLSDCVEQGPFGKRKGGEVLVVGDDGFAEWAYDEVKERRLWVDSLKMVGLEDDEE